MKWYVVAFMLGAAAAAPYSVDEIHKGIEIVGVLMLVALFASLLIPFAAFSGLEKLHKFWLQYAPLVAFGAYSVMILHHPTIIRVILMVSSMGMHLGYWMSGIHSRAFRLEQWRMGFLKDMPATAKLIGSLNGTGRSELGDAVVQAVLQRQSLDAALLADLRQSPYWEDDITKEFEAVLAR